MGDGSLNSNFRGAAVIGEKHDGERTRQKEIRGMHQNVVSKAKKKIKERPVFRRRLFTKRLTSIHFLTG